MRRGLTTPLPLRSRPRAWRGRPVVPGRVEPHRARGWLARRLRPLPPCSDVPVAPEVPQGRERTGYWDCRGG